MNRQSKKSIITMVGSESFTATITNTNSSVAFCSLDPSIFTDRLANISKAYEFFRFTRAKLIIPPQTRWETTIPFTNTAQAAAVGFVPEQPVSATSALTLQNVLALQVSKPFQYNLGIEGAASTFVTSVPGNTGMIQLNVPKSVLMAVPGKWYRNNSISEDPLNVQGTFLLAVGDTAGANTVLMQGQFVYTIQFSGQANSAVI